MSKRLHLLAAGILTALAAGCSNEPKLFGTTIVNAPEYGNARVFQVSTVSTSNVNCQDSVGIGCQERWVWQSINIPNETDADGKACLSGSIIDDGSPVSIAVRKVALPDSAFESEENKKDIAVVLDIAAKEGEHATTLAVWYERNVKMGRTLSFDSLVVYSQDNWDNRVAPYFRVRIVDVAKEKRKAALQTLNQVAQFGQKLSNVFALPLASPVIQIAKSAAELALGGKKNKILVDYQFQLFSDLQRDNAGGIPLGLFREGGLLIVAQPRTEAERAGANPSMRERDYWALNEARFAYNFASDLFKVSKTSPNHNYGDMNKNGKTTTATQKQLAERNCGAEPDNNISHAESAYEFEVVDAPFLMTTVLSTGTVVPNIVQKRSQEIVELLNDAARADTSLEGISDAIEGLKVSTEALREKELFAKNPTKVTFNSFVDNVVGGDPTKLDPVVLQFLLSSMRSVTGVRLGTLEGYRDWISECAAKTNFEPNLRRFVNTDKCGEDIESQKTDAETAASGTRTEEETGAEENDSQQ